MKIPPFLKENFGPVIWSLFFLFVALMVWREHFRKSVYKEYAASEDGFRIESVTFGPGKFSLLIERGTGRMWYYHFYNNQHQWIPIESPIQASVQAWEKRKP